MATYQISDGEWRQQLHAKLDAILDLRIELEAEQFKAWSQNLGHDQTLTTFTSYGTLEVHRQGEIMRNVGRGSAQDVEGIALLLERAGLRLERV